MKNIYLSFGFLSRVLMLAVPLMLTACGGDDSSSQDDVESTFSGSVGGDSSSLDDVESTFSGSVGDGPIVGATLRIYDKDHNLIQTVISESEAKYSTRIKSKGSAYPLTIEVENGTDLVTGMVPDFKMVSVVLHPSVKHANINPFSTMIVAAARTASGDLSEESISAARIAVMGEMNFGLDPLIVADPISIKVTDSNVAVMTKSSEAMGEMIRRVRDQMIISGAAIDGNDVVAALADDISDGIVNGVGGNLANPRISAVSKLVSAQVLIEALSNNLKVQGAVATSRLDIAITETHPSAGLEQLTANVTINGEMLEQTSRTLDAAQALVPSIGLGTLSDILDSIPADSLPSDIEPVLPGDSGVDLEPVITRAVFATDEELELVNNDSQTGPPVDGNDPVNNAPQLSGNPLTSVLEGSDYLFQPDASDVDGDMLVFTVSNKPSWASFDSTNGRLAGTPGSMDAGVYSNIVLSVSDGSATDSVGPFSITVGSVNHAPSISGNAPSNANEGVAYSFKPTASDPDGDSLVFSISGRPSWTSFNNSTGQLSGTPGASDAGTYSNIVISVSDGTASSSLPAFSIVANANAPSNTAPTISGSPPTTVAEGSLYVYQPNVFDADGDKLTFSISNRPAWASFNTGTGRLSGTPGNSDAGAYNNVIINVSDGSASASTGTFNITVTNTNAVPTISGSPSSSVAEDSAYVFQPTASDADGDKLTFSISNRPAWASFDANSGRLAGTPDNGDVGTYSSIRISVSDGSVSASTGPFSITVNNTNDAPVISGSPTASVEENNPYSFQPSASDPDGDNLVFSITGRPYWASFNSSNGGLSGTPAQGDAGTYSNIVISVSDGSVTTVLPAFNIQVDAAQVQTGGFILSWTAPVSRADGTSLSLSEIASYSIYYGTSPGSYSNSIDVAYPSQTRTVTNLPVGTYYVAMTTRDSGGRESAYSQEVKKVAQ
jgi:hypothetical protein